MAKTQQIEQKQSIPKFETNQIVQFIGGIGKIKTFQPNSGTWTYAVEMEMSSTPEVGRVGSETTILLQEADIKGVIKVSGNNVRKFEGLKVRTCQRNQLSSLLTDTRRTINKVQLATNKKLIAYFKQSLPASSRY
jgi:hypothetical protein